MAKKVFLTMSDKLYSLLEKKTEDNGYLTVQETVNSILREKLIPAEKPKSAGAGGRSKAFELEDLYARDKTKEELIAEQVKKKKKK